MIWLMTSRTMFERIGVVPWSKTLGTPESSSASATFLFRSSNWTNKITFAVASSFLRSSKCFEDFADQEVHVLLGQRLELSERLLEVIANGNVREIDAFVQ